MQSPPLDYAPPLDNKANRRYTIALLVLAFFSLIGVGEFLFIARAPKFNNDARWAFQFCAYIYAIYATAIAITLVLRAYHAYVGRIATMALNIVLLPMFPFGTVVGIYGLRKVDKGPIA
jgi:hypothetical protein